MAMQFELDELYTIMREVFGLRHFEFDPRMSAEDIPGWNSLNHTILLMQIESETGVELSAAETVDLPDIHALYMAIRRGHPGAD